MSRSISSRCGQNTLDQDYLKLKSVVGGLGDLALRAGLFWMNYSMFGTETKKMVATKDLICVNLRPNFKAQITCCTK